MCYSLWPLCVPSGSLFMTVGRRIGRVWRFFGTALSFAIFGLFGLLIGVVFFPVLTLLVWNRKQRSRIGRAVIGWSMGMFVEIMRGLGVLRYQIRGAEHIDGLTHAVIAANHPSLIDVVFLISRFPRAECVVKHTLWLNPCTRWALMAANYIPNRDPIVVLDECVRRVADGANLIVFPEGTRTTPGEPPRFSRGPATIAARANGRLLPVRIDCNPTTLTKAEPWYHIPSRQVLFEMEFLPALEADEYLARHGSERSASTAMNDDLRELLVNRRQTR